MNNWTPEELEALDSLYEHATWDEITKALPNRSLGAIRRKASDRDLSRPEDDVKSERAQSGIKGRQISLMRQRIKMTLRHPIEAAWRGLAQTS